MSIDAGAGALAARGRAAAPCAGPLPIPPEVAPDVCIVGGGLVGLTLAGILAPAGLRVALIEATPLGSPGAGHSERAIALSLGSARILESAARGEGGAWARLVRLASPIRAVHVSEQGRPGVTRIEAARLGLPALGYVASAHDIAGALAGGVAGAPAGGGCVRVLAPARLQGLELRSGEACARVETAAGTEAVHARLLVAADGGQSLVRRLIGVPAHVHDYRQWALSANVSLADAHGGTAYERFTPRGPIALLPLGRRRLGLIWTADRCTIEALLAAGDREFLGRLAHAFGPRLGPFLRVGPRAALPLHRACSTRQHHARVVLVGNAVNHLHPVAGQGFNLGVRDAAVLAETLVSAWRAGHDIAAPSVLAGYAARRVPDHRRTARFTDGLVNTFSNELPGLGAARTAALLACELLPPLKRALARRAMGLGVPGRLGPGRAP